MAGSLFRSELMSRCQLYLPPEAAFNCIAELGELGLVQFVDINPDVSSFQRQFVSEIKRCEEMERKLRYIETEIRREVIDIDQDEIEPPAPAPREMVELENSLTTVENNLKEVNTNYVALRKNHLELTEYKSMLKKTEIFLSESRFNFPDADEGTRLLDDLDDNGGMDVKDDQSSMKFNIVAGVIDRARQIAFERMLWRVSKGNVFIKFADIEERMEDPKTGGSLYKSVFMIFFQGEELKIRVKKICDGFHASIYPCPEKGSERREMMIGVNTRLEDLHTVLTQTTEHRHRLLLAASRTIKASYVKVRKMKAIYHILNQFSLRDAQRVLIGECWMPTSDIPMIKNAINIGAQNAGSSVTPTLERVPTTEEHPTFNRTNKYTAVFQSLIDAYGINSYREVNPSVYTIATFPFLFAVMFGDAGHGLIILVASLWMIIAEKSLEKKREISEIFNIFFGGRYIIFLMSIFSIYTGLIYNDIFSKSFNIFGSYWATNLTFSASADEPIKLGDVRMLDPKQPEQYIGNPYPFGIDPVWQSATNKISFLNTYKMKISLIFGVIHMSFGVALSLWNKVSKRHYHEIFLEFFPQIIFLLFLFGYLITMIFIKWVLYGANYTGQWSEHCAPNLLITFINMMLFKSADIDEKLKDCHVDGMYYEIYMYNGQAGLQKFLVIFGVLMIPIMLLGKPLHQMYRKKRDRARRGTAHHELLEESSSDSGEGEEVEEEGMGEIMIHQGIHTIEYVLGSISHTASYLRLWALSLAHAQLSEVLWSMVMRMGFTKGYAGCIMLYLIFAFWACATVSILVLMEGLSAFLHTLRLHWVEFQSKFYEGTGYSFVPFSFRIVLKEAAADDKEVMKTISTA
ncbi:V-type proton ATPase 116 kDa subunit a-like isoform X3 [Eurytemora carolleeae]|nr:V-type proton ATPase 116 kDa subunit a-like isoform X3 [Eurytemora carolleeae]XP_023320180.1 V-type proton ATPase 116 kDa subunit a-like isoform X3 [Eurytemora carolleeae]|eukprot:XP_023320179.1 V-type proton ATPase 116 kDa subunit a-like isoform X3 [Eurytemora affinis]